MGVEINQEQNKMSKETNLTVFVKGQRYVKDANIKMCNYHRTNLFHPHQPRTFCDQKALPFSCFCKYHKNGGTALKPTVFFRFPHHYYDELITEPAKNDLKIQMGKYYKFNGSQWRKLCLLCNKFARPTYCRQHDSRFVSDLKTKGISAIACRFIDRLQHLLQKPILHTHVTTHGLTIGQEKRFGKFKVDGYLPEQKMVFEFLGDYWHGNVSKYDPNQYNLTVKKTFGTLHKQTFSRLSKLQQVHQVKVLYIWESDYRQWVKSPLSKSHPESLWKLLQPIHNVTTSSVTNPLVSNHTYSVSSSSGLKTNACTQSPPPVWPQTKQLHQGQSTPTPNLASPHPL